MLNKVVNKKTMHLIYLPDQSLAYLEIPKNASTSIKSEFLRLTNSDVFKELEAAPTFHIHQFFGRQPTFWLSRQEVKQFSGYKFTIIRDPIERFCSAFSNRIIEEKEHISTPKSVAALYKARLPLQPSINEFANNLEIYASANEHVFHHFRPQSDYIIDRSMLNGVFLITELPQLTDAIKSHNGIELNLPKKNASQQLSYGLDRQAIKKLRAYYYDDYVMFPELAKIGENF